MGSLLSKAARGGFDTLSKGLFRKYESSLRQEEEEANFLREQHLATYKNDLDMDRMTAMKNLDASISRGTSPSGFTSGDRIIPLSEYESMTDEQKGGLTSISQRTMDLGREKATFDNETVRQINESNIISDAEQLYDVYAEGSTEFASLIDKPTFVKDMKLMAFASKGEKELSNSEMIDLYKIQSEAWTAMATDNPDEMTKRIGDAGGDEAKARSNFLMEGRAAIGKSGKSGREKVKGIVSSATKQKTVQHFKTIPQDQAVQEIMDKQKVGRKEAIQLFEEVTGDTYKGEGKDEAEQEGLLSKPKEYGPAHAGRGLLRDLGINITKPKKGKALIDALQK